MGFKMHASPLTPQASRKVDGCGRRTVTKEEGDLQGALAARPRPMVCRRRERAATSRPVVRERLRSRNAHAGRAGREQEHHAELGEGVVAIVLVPREARLRASLLQCVASEQGMTAGKRLGMANELLEAVEPHVQQFAPPYLFNLMHR